MFTVSYAHSVKEVLCQIDPYSPPATLESTVGSQGEPWPIITCIVLLQIQVIIIVNLNDGNCEQDCRFLGKLTNQSEATSNM